MLLALALVENNHLCPPVWGKYYNADTLLSTLLWRCVRFVTPPCRGGDPAILSLVPLSGEAEPVFTPDLLLPLTALSKLVVPSTKVS
jgi:hypothetical protein